MVKRFSWDENEGGWCDNRREIFAPQEVLVRATDYDAIVTELNATKARLAEYMAEIERWHCGAAQDDVMEELHAMYMVDAKHD